MDHAMIQNVGERLQAFEAGLLDDFESIDLFQFLVDSGLAWQLQGNYGRTAVRLIEVGAVRPGKGRAEA